MEAKNILDMIIEKSASDAFVRVHSPIRLRIFSAVVTVGDRDLTISDVEGIIGGLVSETDREMLKQKHNCEFAVCYSDRWRFRVAVFYQRNTPSLVIRKIDLNMVTFDDLALPSKVLEGFCKERRGLILVTGMTGSGKSTAIASMIEYINVNLPKHVLTIEEPVEYTFKDKRAIVTQREIGRDVRSYEEALRQSINHSPDVIYISNIRDRETCHAALTAAETGVLVLSTIHSINATSTIERLVNFFPAEHHHFIFNQLSFLLKGVLSLRLLPRSDTGGLVPAYEVMTLSPTIATLINEHKIWEIPKYIASSDIFGMKSFNQCLWELINSKKISVDTAMDYSDEKTDLSLALRR